MSETGRRTDLSLSPLTALGARVLRENVAAALGVRVARANVTLIDTALFGEQWECETGQTAEPVGCERHSTHHYCKTCEGWYSVPHTGMHSGRRKHPQTDWGRYCACRPCVQWREADPRA